MGEGQRGYDFTPRARGAILQSMPNVGPSPNRRPRAGRLVLRSTMCLTGRIIASAKPRKSKLPRPSLPLPFPQPPPIDISSRAWPPALDAPSVRAGSRTSNPGSLLVHRRQHHRDCPLQHLIFERRDAQRAHSSRRLGVCALVARAALGTSRTAEYSRKYPLPGAWISNLGGNMPAPFSRRRQPRVRRRAPSWSSWPCAAAERARCPPTSHHPATHASSRCAPGPFSEPSRGR
jgi:hypothetical protein